MARHINIPVFIPHLGCPNNCVFCNQRTISGVSEFVPESFVKTVREALITIEADAEVEIAFFGGSFTGIDRGLMISLLTKAREFVREGRVHSIRCSTRPDYIDPEIIGFLKEYGVNTVELGLQSSSDRVLFASKRGHSANDEIRACKLITEAGIELVGQMIGLPSSTPESEIETARFIIDSGASAVRIYPCVVFKDTELANMLVRGEYTPLTHEEAVSRSAAVLREFIDADITVLRIGLHSSENLRSEDTYLAGPNHPALGELIVGEVYYEKTRELLLKMEEKPDVITVFAPVGCVSKVLGHGGRNKIRLVNEFGILRLTVKEDEGLSDYQVRI